MYDGVRAARPATSHAWKMLILSVAVVLFAATVDGKSTPRRGQFAFCYAPSLTNKQIAWYSQFDVLVTHDPLPAAQRKALHAAGTKLVLYEWSVAFYDSRATAWEKSLIRRSHDALLNAAPLKGGAGSITSGAWYFDPAADGHASERATALARRLEETGYDGLFFDTTTAANVHADALKEYDRRHPGIRYDMAFSRVLLQLRKQHPRGIIFTNQGYRAPDHYLPYADWDLTESLITRPNGSGHEMRPWNDTTDPWSSTAFVMKTMIAPVAARFPKVRFAHLNYIDKPDPEAIRAINAIAQLFDAAGYAASAESNDETDSIYFRDPGSPVSDRIDHADGQGAHRFFQNGLIAIRAAGEITIENLSGRGLRNHFTGELNCGPAIRLPGSTGQPRASFFDVTSACAGR